MFAKNTIEDIVDWIARRNREVKVSVQSVPFAELKGWHFEDATGNLVHDSGKFFSIVGVDVMTNHHMVNRWRQPIINQPEVGFLGIIAKEVEGELYLLFQAKIEPGNVNCVQLSPTLQATRSNYTCVHGGKKPAYLEYFLNAKPEHILVDQLQSEQGARFLRKRNRNIIIKVEEDVPVLEDFRWVSLAQVKELIRRDNMVNMDTRTVLSGLRMHGEEAGASLLSIDDILFRLSDLKTRYELITDKIPLKAVNDWQVTDTEIVRPDRRYFRVLGVNVEIANREVARWCQPIVEPMQQGLCVLFCQRKQGVMHYLLQAKVECGNFDVVELAPTIQCLTGDFRLATEPPRFVREFLADTIPGRKLFDTLQSEEGGRFYHEQNRNVAFELAEDVELPPSPDFFWLTMPQIKEFLRFNNYLNTSEGGGIFSSDPAIDQRLRELRFFGYDATKDVARIGTNAKMTEVNAAIGLANLKYMDAILADRRKKYDLYKSILSSAKGVTFQKIDPSCNCSYFPLVFDTEEHLLAADAALKEINVFARRYFYPSVNTYKTICPDAAACPHSVDIANRILCLPLYSTLPESSVKTIAELILKAL